MLNQSASRIEKDVAAFGQCTVLPMRAMWAGSWDDDKLTRWNMNTLLSNLENAVADLND